jgi:murein DD-endopeptidase MepM/ murein hydrolase activator NlpD
LWVVIVAVFVGTAIPIGLRHPLSSGEALASETVALWPALAESVLRPHMAPGLGTALPPLKNYVVQRGDTLPSIASRAGISPETLIQVNHLPSGDALAVGLKLLVPPIDGIMITLKPGQSASQLADAFRVSATAVTSINRLSLESPAPDEVFIPAPYAGAVASRPEPLAPTANRRSLVRFIWPTQGVVSQGFWPYHPGMDIANNYGTPEVASDGGKVTFAGWGSYGIYVEIDHGNGFSSIYGHMSKTVVTAGQEVTQGQPIGLMGCTGICTGSHLHFEIRYMGVPQNPMNVLP